MEESQRVVITKNLSSLVQNTVVNTLMLIQLRTRGVLSNEDVEYLSTQKTQFEKAYEFYKLIITRRGGYEALLQALTETKQSGALKLLLKSEHPAVTPDQDNTKTEAIEIPTPSKKFRDVPYNLMEFFLSTHHSLIYCTIDDTLTIEKITQNCDDFFILTNTSKAATIAPGYPVIPQSNPESLSTENEENVTILLSKQLIEQPFSLQNFVTRGHKMIVIMATLDAGTTAEMKRHQIAAVEITEDKFLWSDLTLPCQNALLTHKILDQGRSKSLKTFCSHIVYETSPEEYLNRFLNGQLLVDLIRDEIPVIYRHTIPPAKFYIKRKLVLRNRLDSNFFNCSENSMDLFYFTGIERHELSDLVPGKVYTLQQCKNNLVSKKFILGPNDHTGIQEFNDMCNSVKENVHWFVVNNSNFYWKTSKKSTSIFLDFIRDSDVDEVYEEEFLDMLENCKRANPVCICDSPGMGKSVVLASLARKLMDRFESRFVLFIILTEFIDILQLAQQQTDTSFKTSIMTALKRIASGNEFGDASFQNDSRKVELMFDGLDELSSKHIELAISCFKTIPKIIKSARIFVTSRRNLLKMLASELQTLVYNIKPFDKQDQIKFLSDYWCDERMNQVRQTWSKEEELSIYELNRREKLLLKHINPNRAKQFASVCLEKIGKCLHPNNKDIAGIPLQCMLIAQVFCDQGAYFADSKVENEECASNVDIISILDLYKRFVTKRLEAYQKRREHEIESILDWKCIMKIHFCLASSLVFPMWATKLKDVIFTPQLYEEFQTLFRVKPAENFEQFRHGKLSPTELPRFGFLDAVGNDGNPHFVHRTFAEYFLALFVTEQVNLDDNLRVKIDLNEYLHTALLQTTTCSILLSVFLEKTVEGRKFQHSVVCYFLNSLMTSGNRSKDKSWDITNDEFEACVNGDLENLFLFLCHDKHLKDFNRIPDKTDLLSVAIKQTSSDFFDTISQIYRTNYDLANADKAELLYIAVEKGNYLVYIEVCRLIKLKEYLASFDVVSKHDLISRLLSACISESECDEVTVEDKIDIVKHLLSLYNKENDHGLVLFAVNLHAKLLLCIDKYEARTEDLRKLLNTAMLPHKITYKLYDKYLAYTEIKKGIYLYI